MAPVESAIIRLTGRKKNHRTLGAFKYNKNYEPIRLLFLKGTGDWGDNKTLMVNVEFSDISVAGNMNI